MCFVDLTKAYDTVHRGLLMHKLRNAGIGSKFNAIMTDMLHGVQYTIKTEGQTSVFFESNRGLKQGDPISPKTFNCFMADAMRVLLQEEEVPHLQGVPIPALFFADDVVLMATSAEALQRLINSFVEYCDNNYLQVNVHKTKTIVMGKQPHGACKRLKTHSNRFYVNTTQLEAVQTFTYLGIVAIRQGHDVVM